MAKSFESYKDIIERGLQNDMPVEAKLILTGMMWYSAGPYGDMTHQQYKELEALLGVKEEVERFEDAMEYALVGSLDVPGHVQPEGVAG